MTEPNDMSLYYEWFEGWALRDLHPRMLNKYSSPREVVLCHKIAGNLLLMVVKNNDTGEVTQRPMTSEEVNTLLDKKGMH